MRAKSRGAVLAILLLAGCSAYSPGWSTIHADGSNTDYSALEGPDDVVLAWQRQFDGGINVGATFDRQGRVYLTENSGGCTLHVLDPATGNTIWCSDLLDHFASVSSPLIDDQGRVFVADGRAMHAFDSGGHELWETPIEGVPLSAQFTGHGHLIFMTNIGRLYMLRRDTGAEVMPVVELIPGATWVPADGVLACARGLATCPAANTMAVDDVTDRIYFTFWQPGAPQAGVRAMQIVHDPVPHVIPLWQNDSLPGGSASSPVLSADRTRLYVNDNIDSVHALDAATGAVIWSDRIGFASGGSPSLSPSGLLMPAGGGNSPVLAIQDRGATGATTWRRDDLLDRGIPTQTAGDRSYATVSRGSFQNDLVVLDTTTGAEIDREPLPGTTIFTVGTTVGPDGTIYVPSLNGRLFAFRAA